MKHINNMEVLKVEHYKKCNGCKKVKPVAEFKIGEFMCKDCKAKHEFKVKEILKEK
jgi:hypothetical protein